MKPPPLPPPDGLPTSASSTSTGQAQVPAGQPTSAQPVQRQVAQAVPVTVPTGPTHLPMAKAVPMQQRQGHAQVTVQPDPKAMPSRQLQGHAQLAHPLPQPLYPPQQQLVAVQTRLRHLVWAPIENLHKLYIFNRWSENWQHCGHNCMQHSHKHHLDSPPTLQKGGIGVVSRRAVNGMAMAGTIGEMVEDTNRWDVHLVSYNHLSYCN